MGRLDKKANSIKKVSFVSSLFYAGQTTAKNNKNERINSEKINDSNKNNNKSKNNSIKKIKNNNKKK